MITHLLDTSVYSQPLKRAPVQTAVDRWIAIGDDSCAVSIICEAEILFGIELKQSKSLSRSYEEILKGRLQVISVDDAVAKAYAIIKSHTRRKGLPAAELDLLIAATARAYRLTLATLNRRHFDGIDGITVEDWSKPL